MTTLEVAPVAGDELVPVVTWVRAGRAQQLQADIAELLAREVAGDHAGGYRPPHPRSPRQQDAWALPGWQAGDGPAAAWLVSSLRDHQRRIVGALVASGTAGAWTRELVEAGNYPAGTSPAPVFKAIGGWCRKAGRQPLWNGGPKARGRGQKLTMNAASRALFGAALRAEFPELADEFGIA
jgi:hypothetical protein